MRKIIVGLSTSFTCTLGAFKTKCTIVVPSAPINTCKNIAKISGYPLSYLIQISVAENHANVDRRAAKMPATCTDPCGAPIRKMTATDATRTPLIASFEGR